MGNTFQIKRHNSNTTTTPPGTLANGELALNQAAKQLFVGRHNNSSVEVFHLPTLQDLTYGAGISGTIASGSNDNSSTIALDLTDSNIFASTSAKGIASFASADFSVSSGVVSIGSIGTSQIDDDAITAAKIDDNVINSQHYAADSIDAEHYAPGSVDATALATSAVTSDKILNGTIQNADIADNTISADKLQHDMTLPGNIVTGGNLTVTGDLTVQGTSTTLNTSTLEVEDVTIEIAKNATNSATSDGAGIIVGGWSGCPSILYDDTGTQWEFNKAIEAQQGFVDTTFDCGTY